MINKIKKIIKKVLPKYFLRLIKNWFKNSFIMALHKIIRSAKSPKLPLNKNGKILIHLGCGNQNDKRFINVDALPFSHAHYVQSAEDLAVFPDKYADLVYASHILEHFSHCNIDRILKEWRRVLKIGGILRISVPDFDKIIHIYELTNHNIDKIIGALMGGQDCKYNFHKSAFSEKYLTELFLSVGFNYVRKWDPEKAEYYSFNDWASKRLEKKYPISLNLEAVK